MARQAQWEAAHPEEAGRPLRRLTPFEPELFTETYEFGDSTKWQLWVADAIVEETRAFDTPGYVETSAAEAAVGYSLT